MSSNAENPRLIWAEIFAIRNIHEATLQTLISTRNYATLQLLDERNKLLREQYSWLGLLNILSSHILSCLFNGEKFLVALLLNFLRRTSSHHLIPRPSFRTK
jgi:hypothetical protein